MSKWISVDESLPEKGVDVLCWNGQACCVDQFWQSVGKSVYFLGSREEWRIDITHWMPLPQPPIK